MARTSGYRQETAPARRPLVMARLALWLLGAVLLTLTLSVVPRAAAVTAQPGGDGIRPGSFDVVDMAKLCPKYGAANNLALVVIVRGSGEKLAAGRMPKLASEYYGNLQAALVGKGYRVSGMDISYPALGTNAILNGDLVGFISSSVGFAASIETQLRRAILRCPERKIIIGTYSQGGIALRSAIAKMRAKDNLWNEIDRIDLVADASADPTYDAGMPTGRTPRVGNVTRRATLGIWPVGVDITAAANSTPAKVLRWAVGIKVAAARDIPRTAPIGGYPRALRGRIDRYCAAEDFVCDTGAVLSQAAKIAKEIGCSPTSRTAALACPVAKGPVWGYLKTTLATHTSVYPWKAIALDTADQLGPPPAPAGAIRSVDFLNRDYVIRCPSGNAGGDPESIQVRDGKWSNYDTDGLFPDYVPPLSVGYGEFTGDGIEDATFSTSCTAGGSGSIPSTLVFEAVPGGARQVGSLIIGRNPRPGATPGVLVTSLYIRQADDPAGGESIEQIDTWRLVNGDWAKISSTRIPYSPTRVG